MAMKREFITGLLPEIPKETLDKIMDENGKDVEAVKTKYADYDGLKTQLADAGKTIDGFKALDIDAIQKAANDWKLKAEQAEQDAATKIADLQFNSMLDSAVGTAKGKNAKAIRALLDVETLKTSKNQSEDIKTALDALKTENGYLFEAEGTPPPYAPGTGSTPIVGQYTKETFAKLGYRDRVALKQEHPELYETLKE